MKSFPRIVTVLGLLAAFGITQIIAPIAPVLAAKAAMVKTHVRHMKSGKVVVVKAHARKAAKTVKVKGYTRVNKKTGKKTVVKGYTRKASMKKGMK